MAVAPLDALAAHGFDIALVVTRTDKRRGRGNDLQASPVKQAALRLGIPVSHAVDDCLVVGAEVGVVVAFGQLIKPHVLATLPMVNLHFSLLPRWRGAAPVERALLAGDDVTGVCLMQLGVGLDTGPILDVIEVRISATTTAIELRRELVQVGSGQLIRVLSGVLPHPKPQVGEPTYAAKLSPSEFQIDWTRSADEVHRLVRLGVAWTTYRGRRLKILAADVDARSGSAGEFLAADVVACGNGSLHLRTVQPEAKAAMSVGAWANGARPHVGESLAGLHTESTTPRIDHSMNSLPQ